MVKRLTNPLQNRDLPLGTLMSSAGARLAARLDQGLADAGFADLRAAHAAPFMVMDPGGSRPSQLAARAHMSKQAMGELVGYLVGRGYLETVADPSDGRARLVRPTARGWRALDAGVAVIDAFDAWLDGQLGARGVDVLRKSLHLILEADIP
ncbi:MAG: MarR family winged helix-turn-helix transcriptional regulator [Nocardioides sp.]